MSPDRQLKRICVFCGTNPGSRPVYGSAARELGRVLAEQDIELVYGGASVGIMGELADSITDVNMERADSIREEAMQRADSIREAALRLADSIRQSRRAAPPRSRPRR